MKPIPPSQYDANPSPSGFSILVHSSFARCLARIWEGINAISRPLLPLLHIFMLAVILLILGAVVFANQHTPCWYDEICMVDPAYHRATAGVWRSIAQWDSIDTIPFAPNYPLLINILRLLISIFGVNFWILRGSMLVFGLAPVAALLWLFHRKGFLQSRAEVLHAVYYSACCTFFHWALYLRPEPILLSVIALLVFFWAADRPVLLFLAALLVPLCGFQWNVILLPAVLHWLVFGGRIRNPFLVAVALVISSAATIAAYHALGMWPSYLQEAARVGGLDAFHAATRKLHTALSSWDFSCLFSVGLAPPSVVDGPLAMLAISMPSLCFRGHSDCREKPLFVFLVFSIVACWMALALFGHMLQSYTRPLLLPICLLGPALMRRLFSRYPLLLLGLALCILWFPGVHWQQVKNGHGPWRTFPDDTFWVDEAFMERWIPDFFQPSDVVCCDNSAYFALRRTGRELYRLRYALNMDEASCRRVSYVLMSEKPPYEPGTDFSKYPGPAPRLPDREFESPGELLCAISGKWNCTFIEVPLPVSPMPDAIRFRLFRPVFPADSIQDGS
ncbi:MAG: hypothetical protein IJS32_05940 [Kiritimatiellae bacterium]|nr:hypothetical protein [Kiritimatiellia bacterium]